MSVLLVEDDQPLVELMILNAIGPERVRFARSLKQAIAMIDEKKPEVIILDLSLPDSPTLETLAKISDLKTRSDDAEVIVITGHHDHQKLKERALQLGALNLISKDDRGFFGALSNELINVGKKPRNCASNPIVNEIEKTVNKIVGTEPPYEI